MLKLSFNQSASEIMVRATATIVFNELARKGATTVPLSTVAEKPQYGFTASAETHAIGPKFVRITDLKDGSINWNSVPYCQCTDPEKYLIAKNDILFARTGATTGKTHLVKEAPEAVFASYLIRLRPRATVLPGYLHSFFQSDAYWSQIIEEKEGSAQPNVNGKKLVSIQIPLIETGLQSAIGHFLDIVKARHNGEEIDLPDLPSPLVQSKRIVARIEELAGKVEEARELRSSADQESKMLFSSSGGQLIKAIGEREGFRTLGSVSLKVTDGEHSTPRRSETGNYLLSARNIQNNKITLSPVDYVEDDEFERIQRRCDPSVGDVLISCSGSIGKIALVDKSDTYVMVRSLAMVRPNPEILSAEYLAHVLRSEYLQTQMIEKSRASAQANLFLGKIKSLEVPIPSKGEQQKLVTYLDNLQAKTDALKHIQTQTATELNALLPAILDKAFKGEL